jgi:hypothetical protein
VKSWLQNGKVVGKTYNESEAKTWLGNYWGHYVYALVGTENVPIYIGKGVRHRARYHRKCALNPNHTSAFFSKILSLEKAGTPIKYTFECFDTHHQALHRERDVIQKLGRRDLETGPLYNLTDGGEGTLKLAQISRDQRTETLSGLDGPKEDQNFANALYYSLISDVVYDAYESRSVPLKALPKYEPTSLLENRQSMEITIRQAAAIVASAICNNIKLKEGALIPRRFMSEGVLMVIEDGCGRDMVVSRFVEVSGCVGSETLKLSLEGLGYVKSHFRVEHLDALGVYEKTDYSHLSAKYNL